MAGTWSLCLQPWVLSGMRGMEEPEWDKASATDASLPAGDSKKAKEALGKK